MLTRLVRVQLIIFTIVSLVGVTLMVGKYMQAPTLLGFGHLTVKLELPSSGGLYRLSNVTYRGLEVGKVTAIDLTDTGTAATLSLVTSPQIPADLEADVQSVSAIGEQYVDLRPRTSSPPYLRDGSVIQLKDTSVPQPVGPMLDRASALLGSVPKERLAALLDESATGFNDADFDLGSLLDSSATVSHDFRDVAEQLRALVEDSGPLLDGQAQTADDTRTWARSLAGVTEQLVTNDNQVRTILTTAPSALQEVSQLLDSVKPTLPVLLANLTSLGRVAVTYLPSLEQLLVLVPPFMASLQAISPENNAAGLGLGNFRVQMNDPPACTVGFLPPSQWRSPADTTTADTPDGLYCKLPQDSPILVRGARNLPCMGQPGKRAPTVKICDSDMPYEPLAMREHVFGPGPIDPNLIAQGIPLDARVTAPEHIQAPVEGTLPAAPGAGASEAATPPPGMPDGPLPVAPAASRTDAAVAQSIAVAKYDPRTGRYMAPDGRVHQQTDLVVEQTATSWQDLVLSPGYAA